MANENPGERVIKKAGDSHIIWFSESNKWIEFREPAWFIYQKYISREDEKVITAELSEKYDLPRKESQRFLSEIIAGIKEASRPSANHSPGLQQNPGNQEIQGNPKVSNNTPSPKEYGNPQSTESSKQTGTGLLPFSTRYYLINTKHLSIAYGSPLMEYYFHRPLAHLEEGNEYEPDLSFELYEQPVKSSKKFILYKKLNNKPAPSPGIVPGRANSRAAGVMKRTVGNRESVSSWEQVIADDTGILKHHIYREIAALIYGILPDSWMSYIHASAVTNGKEAMLFSSSSGSGKSTLAALLQLPPDKYFQPDPGSEDRQNHHLQRHDDKELFFISDDFVPVDALTNKAHIFPAALTVKEGSFPAISGFYEPAADADADFGGLKSRRVRYLRPRLHGRLPYKPQPVKKIIFVRYTPGTDFKMERVPLTRALTMFHEEAWVSHNPGHAQNFIDWFVTLSCYRLEYSDIKKARTAILKLFEV